SQQPMARYSCWPALALPEAACSSAEAAVASAANAPASTAKIRMLIIPLCALASLRYDIDERRLAALHHRDRALQRRAELRRIGHRAFGMDAEALRHLREVDVGMGDLGADMGGARIAHMAVRHRLEMHHFLEVEAIVVHHHQDRNFVLGRGPERARRDHEVAIADDRHGKPAMLAVGERRADRAAAAIADAVSAGIAEIVVCLVHLPEMMRPVARG